MPTHKIDWTQIETVLLDMDGTLLDLHFDWHFWMHFLPQAYADKNQLLLVEANAIVRTKIIELQGTLNWYCLDYWTEEFNLPVAKLKHELKHMIQPHPEVITFLSRLKQHGKQVVMVTNSHRDSLDLKLEMTEIGGYFDAIISSHDYGIPKENPKIWQYIQSASTFDSSKTLLIDDNITALKTAQSFGIAHCLAAIHVSPKLDKVDPQGFPYFENFNEIMPTLSTLEV